MSIFETLSKINVNQFTEKKNNLTYLPWAYAWGTLKGLYPASFYAVAENKDGWNYFTDGRTCWVKCCVTAVDGDDHQTAVEYLPVMDYRNNAIPVDQVTSTAVNKAIQRCLTKAIARLGLGLYIYAGEDLPDGDETETKPAPKKAARKPLTDEQYWTIVANEGQGNLTKLGWPYRTAWIENYKPSEEEIAKFDHDVDLWRAANQPQK
jgi:hypothetical protein